jgi:hypothetical protein
LFSLAGISRTSFREKYETKVFGCGDVEGRELCRKRMAVPIRVEGEEALAFLRRQPRRRAVQCAFEHDSSERIRDVQATPSRLFLCRDGRREAERQHERRNGPERGCRTHAPNIAVGRSRKLEIPPELRLQPDDILTAA